MSRTNVETSWRGLVLTGTYSYDPGCRTLRNGDPGYPPSCEAHLNGILPEVNDPEAFEAADDAMRATVVAGIKLTDAAEAWLLARYDDELHDALAEAGAENEDNADERGGCDDE